MPGPDPDAIELGDDGRIWFRHRVGPSALWPFGAKVGTNEMRNREARASAIALNIRRDNWTCGWCQGGTGLHKRADALFCRERCRKANARARRGFLRDRQRGV